MKCPKCDYLGFETGTRCRHCGYDFSLLTFADAGPARAPVDLSLRPDEPPAGDASRSWLDVPLAAAGLPAAHDVAAAGLAVVGDAAALPSAPAGTTARRRVDPSLPLFAPPATSGDQPLVRVPAAPRPPLSVRRTPEAPRLAVQPPSLRRDAGEPAIAAETVLGGPRLRDATPYATVDADLRVTPAAAASSPATGGHGPPRRGEAAQVGHACAPGPRLTAALIDLTILIAIDLAVVYFTLRMAGVPAADWRVLPAAPLVAFLTLLKLAYYSAFTAFGGQTIGKMATHIRVVSDDDGYLDPARSVRRACAAVASVLTLGAGFVPALVGPTRQALHDRVARTRVVALPSA